MLSTLWKVNKAELLPSQAMLKCKIYIFSKAAFRILARDKIYDFYFFSNIFKDVNEQKLKET